MIYKDSIPKVIITKDSVKFDTSGSVKVKKLICGLLDEGSSNIDMREIEYLECCHWIGNKHSRTATVHNIKQDSWTIVFKDCKCKKPYREVV